MSVIAMRGPAGHKQCAMTGLPKGDCTQDVERTPTGQHTEYCMYHNKVVAGVTTPIRPEGYGNRIPRPGALKTHGSRRYNPGTERASAQGGR